MQLQEFLSLLLFIVLAIPHAIISKIRSCFTSYIYRQRTIVALPYSHFSEKVFWAHDRSKVAYDIRHVFQGFFPTTLLEFASTTVPIVVDGSRVIRDSKDALNELSIQGNAWLYPSAAVHEIESRFCDAFGKSVARILYHHLFTTDEGNVLLRRMWKVGVSPLEQLLVDPLYPACRFAMMGGMNIPGDLDGSIAAVDEAFDRVTALLQDGRKYICSTPEMTAADVTFASLAYPLVLPDEKADVLCSWNDKLPEVLRKEVRRRRASPAGQFVLRLYKEERHL